MVGLARGFLFAGAAATVVSLWSVDDESTPEPMEQMYKHLMDGRTTAQALRLAMLHLVHGRSESSQNSRWRRPLYWAAFLVVGVSTRLPGRGDTLEDDEEDDQDDKEDEDDEGLTGKKPPETVPGETKKSSGVSSGMKLILTLKKKPKKVTLKRQVGEKEEEEEEAEAAKEEEEEQERHSGK